MKEQCSASVIIIRTQDVEKCFSCFVLAKQRTKATDIKASYSKNKPHLRF